MTETGNKVESAFRTIGELSKELGLPQHILRYWETKFPQLRPLQRAGNRRYYRPDDVALAHNINGLLYQQGYTVKGVQKLLRAKPEIAAKPLESIAEERVQHTPVPPFDRLTETGKIWSQEGAASPSLIARLIIVRDRDRKSTRLNSSHQ